MKKNVLNVGVRILLFIGLMGKAIAVIIVAEIVVQHLVMAKKVGNFTNFQKKEF